MIKGTNRFLCNFTKFNLNSKFVLGDFQNFGKHCSSAKTTIETLLNKISFSTGFLFLSEEEDLNLPPDDDAFLFKFLRPCKFYPESTFRLVRNPIKFLKNKINLNLFQMKRFYKFKLKYPKYGQDLMPSRVKHVFEEEVMIFMPTRLPSGSRIMLANLGSELLMLRKNFFAKLLIF